MRILCFIRTSSFRSKELSMTTVLVVAMIVIVAEFVIAMIALGKLSAKWAAEQPNFEASLAKNLPPDVQTDMNPIQPGLVTSVAITVVVLPIAVAGLSATGQARAALFAGFGLVGAVACVTWTASIARTWLDRRQLTLSP
jgi:hypothetical protein